MSNLESRLEVEFAECATWLVNRVEGQRPEDLGEADAALYQASSKLDNERGVYLLCQVAGCGVAWALNKDEKGVLSREQRAGLPVCPDS